MPQLSRIRQVALKVEASEGTAETLTSSEVLFESEEADADYTNEMNERNPRRASLSHVQSLPGIGVTVHTGKLELVGGGAVATVPPSEKLWLCNGLLKCTVKSVALSGAPTGTFRPGEKISTGAKIARFIVLIGTVLYYAVISGTDFAAADTITGSKSAATATVNGTPAVTARGFAYKPQDPDSAGAYTFQTNKDGKRWLSAGSRGTGNISIDGAGKIGYLNYTVSGAGVKPIDLPVYSGAVLPVVTPESFLSASLAADGDLLCVDGFGFDMGNTVARRPCANASAGIRSFRITDRKPTITIAPEADLEAVKDFFAEYDAGTSFGFFAQLGQTATKKCIIAAPAATWKSIKSGDRDGIETYEATLELNGSETDGDDEYLIAFL